MILNLPDDPALAELSENDLLVDLACGLYAAGRISRSGGARMAGLDEMTFDQELRNHHISSYTEDMLLQDVGTMKILFPE